MLVHFVISFSRPEANMWLDVSGSRNMHALHCLQQVLATEVLYASAPSAELLLAASAVGCYNHSAAECHSRMFSNLHLLQTCVSIVGNTSYRPGRLDKILYVPLPPPEGRGAILQALTRKTPLAVDVDVEAVGASPHCHGFSGADLAALVREACICALKVCPPQLARLLGAVIIDRTA